jgi:hypothetical protein
VEFASLKSGFISCRDGGRFYDFLESAFSCAAADASSTRRPTFLWVEADGTRFPALRFWERKNGEHWSYEIEYTTDLATWHLADGRDGRPAVVEVSRSPACPLTDQVIKRLDQAPARAFLRLRVRCSPD